MLALNRPISPARILLLAAALLVAAVGAAGAANVSFDLEPLGSTWGGSVGNVPGDLAFTEDGIPMTVDEFHLGAFTGFNYCRIEPAIPAFGSGQILRLNNIATVFDFSAVPCAPGTVRFDFADQGGDENLRVNGGPLYEIGDFTAVDGVTVAPGVLCSVVASVVGGSLVGTVTLTGPVTKLLVGGQELYIDNVRMDCEEPCDFRVTHDFEPLGSCWGSAFGQAPGDLAFTEDGIPVTLDLYDYGAGTFFTAACIVNTFCGMGDAHAFQLDNIDAVYQIHALGITTSEVSFEFIDTGGTENLQVNGGPLYIGEISAAPAAIAPGVTCSVVTFPCNGNIRGIVTLTGDVQRVRTGGQEYWVDNLCVRAGEPPLPCDLLVDNESQPLGAAWGAVMGDAPGDLMFVEDGVPVRVYEMHYGGGGVGFNEAKIDPAPAACLTDHTLQLNNIAAGYDIAATGVHTVSVRFDYVDLGGTENLQVNGGPLYIGDLAAAPAAIAPGVTCSVSTFSIGGGVCGRVTLTGDVQRLFLAGQEFWTDNLCITVDLTAADEAPSAGFAADLDPAWPNPFNPKTTLSFSLAHEGDARLSIHDVLGREVAVLVDGPRPAGSQQVSWDGRDAAGRPVSSGVYFARLVSAGERHSRKLVLSK
ncbi:MAG: T9SS type A sorting domain-containing protein [Candidatus Latescibacteria bacterium]|nr:T9SS type A sorting domain-containing protein [Candidatus Latescibacterota bacterium]